MGAPEGFEDFFRAEYPGIVRDLALEALETVTFRPAPSLVGLEQLDALSEFSEVLLAALAASGS